MSVELCLGCNSAIRLDKDGCCVYCGLIVLGGVYKSNTNDYIICDKCKKHFKYPDYSYRKFRRHLRDKHDVVIMTDYNIVGIILKYATIIKSIKMNKLKKWIGLNFLNKHILVCNWCSSEFFDWGGGLKCFSCTVRDYD